MRSAKKATNSVFPKSEEVLDSAKETDGAAEQDQGDDDTDDLRHVDTDIFPESGSFEFLLRPRFSLLL